MPAYSAVAWKQTASQLKFGIGWLPNKYGVIYLTTLICGCVYIIGLITIHEVPPHTH